uniref:Uncharacterized protein n=1 Tax=Ciona savignyi TaxID=51511 RepID=H2YDJ6_CIOSA
MEIRVIEEIEEYIYKDEGKWSRENNHVLTSVDEIYQRFTPEYLKKSIPTLLPDMLVRLLRGKSRWMIFDMESCNMKLRFSKDRLKSIASCYVRDRDTLHARGIALFSEVAEQLRKTKCKTAEKNYQKMICDKLHLELSEMYSRQAEMMKIEESLMQQQRLKQEEERKRSRLKMENKRKEIRAHVVEFNIRKAELAERQRQANEK